MCLSLHEMSACSMLNDKLNTMYNMLVGTLGQNGGIIIMYLNACL